MSARLALGVIALQRRSLLSAIVMVATFSGMDRLPAWILGGVLILLATGAGMGATNELSTRTVAILPIGARDHNRATWILVAVLPMLILTAGRGLRVLLSALFGDGSSWPVTPVHSFYEVLFFAVVAAWCVLVPDRHAPDFREDTGLYRTVLGFIGGTAVPFVVLPYLPSTFGGITAAGWLLTVLAVAVAASPLVLKPKQYVRRPPPRLADAGALPTPPVPPAAPAVLEAARVRGIWIPLRSVMAYASLWALVMVAFLVVVQHNKEVVTIWSPFDGSMPAMRFFISICLPLLFVLGMAPGLVSWLAALRRLPLSARQVAWLLSLAPAATPVMFWAVLAVIHVLVMTQLPDTFRLGHLSLFVGMSALADACGTRFGSPMAKFGVAGALVMTFTYAMDGNRPLVESVLQHWALPLTGVLGVSAAWLVNFHTLTRSGGSSPAYRRAVRPASMGAR